MQDLSHNSRFTDKTYGADEIAPSYFNLHIRSIQDHLLHAVFLKERVTVVDI